MYPKQAANTATTAFQRLAGSTGILFFGMVGVFAIWYLVTDYRTLADWFLKLSDCFYKRAEWTTDFFTPAVKRAGNYYAGAGLLLSVAGVAATARAWRNDSLQLPGIGGRITVPTMVWSVAVSVVAIAAAVAAWRHLLPASDEVFSVVKCTEMPPFITLAYYLLPNNHIYYNLANHFLFGWVGDYVVSGRAMSVAAYVVVAQCVFYLLHRLSGQRWIAFVAMQPVVLGVYTLGFAVQARGYELQLLCGWVAFIALHFYNGNPSFMLLTVSAVANIAGFLLIPGYLYYYLAQLLCQSILMVVARRVDVGYIKAQAFMAAMVFMCYLPALCFSGVQAFTSNGWVAPSTEGLATFLPRFADTVLSFISDCLGGIGGHRHPANYVVFLLPYTLLITGKAAHRRLVLYYTSIWVAFILYTMFIKRIPFHRVLIIQFSITGFVCVYALVMIAQRLVQGLGSKVLQGVAYVGVLLLPVGAYTGFLINFHQHYLAATLYSYDINAVHTAQIVALRQIPPGSSVAFSEDAFYYYYYCRLQGYNVSRSADGSATYLIKIKDRPFPAGAGTAYTYWADASNDYGIYKK